MKSAVKDLRCIACRLPIKLCLCAEAPQLQLTSKVSVVMHRKELNRRTNTVILARLLLQDQLSLRFRGQNDRVPVSEDHLELPDYENIVLFPDEHSQELKLAHLEGVKPIHFIVSDGSWNQAKRTVRRLDVLRRLPKYHLPLGPPSRYHLRRSPMPEGVCTYEAIARALGVIEGKGIQETMEKFFEKAMEAALELSPGASRTQLIRGLGQLQSEVRNPGVARVVETKK